MYTIYQHKKYAAFSLVTAKDSALPPDAVEEDWVRVRDTSEVDEDARQSVEEHGYYFSKLSSCRVPGRQSA